MIRILVAISVLSTCLAHRGWKSPSYSPLDLAVTTCLSNLQSLGVEVVVDIQTPQVTNYPYYGYYYGNRGSRSSRQVSNFIEQLSQGIPSANFYVVLIDGTAGNQTNYYVSMANAASIVTTTTTVPNNIVPVNPAVRFYRKPKKYYGGYYGGYYNQYPSTNTIGSLVRTYLDSRVPGSQSILSQLPQSKAANAPVTGFRIVLTDSLQQTPIAQYGTANVIIDVGGNLALNNRSYRTNNIWLSKDMSYCPSEFLKTLRYQICQTSSGLPI